MLIGGDWAASAIVEGGRSRDLVSVMHSSEEVAWGIKTLSFRRIYILNQ